jgi:type IV pilus assembly protein PilW
MNAHTTNVQPRSINVPRMHIGFTLVEVLVGMAMALIGVVIMMQVTTAFESQKRSTTSGEDAQNTGAIALFQLQRDLRMAGFGISSRQLIGCTMTLNSATLTIMPVLINPTGITPMALGANGRDAGTDSVIIMYGEGNGSVEGDSISNMVGGNVYAVQAPTGYSVGDRVIAARTVQPNPCSGGNSLVLDRVTGIAGQNVTVAGGVAGMTNQTLFNVGQTLNAVGYIIRNGTLKRCDFFTTDCTTGVDTDSVWVPIANSIAALRLDNGRDTTPIMDGTVDVWDQAIAATTPPACGGLRVSAVRVGLLARSGQYERDPITTGAADKAPLPTWDGSVAFDLAANVAVEPNWQHYRYRVMQTVVPIRNIAMAGGVTGC